MVSSGRHPKKDVADALDGIEADGFTIRPIHKSHQWGRLICLTCGEPDGALAINCTPKSQSNHAKAIARFRRKHQH